MVCTSARSSLRANTAASSPVGAPTSTRGSVAAGRSMTIGRRSAAASLQPQPAPLEGEVRGMESLTDDIVADVTPWWAVWWRGPPGWLRDPDGKSASREQIYHRGREGDGTRAPTRRGCR